MLPHQAQNIAVVGAGMAGAACARALSLAGHTVHVFDKSRGPGGRLATRRMAWSDAQGQEWLTRLDHGAVAIQARSLAFQAFIDQALGGGALAHWAPTLAPNSLPTEPGARHYLPQPDMPALCRHLLEGVAATWSFGVDTLHQGPLGWQLAALDVMHPACFDAVVLALPPAQAAPLLAPHRSDWAHQASTTPMAPCWTLLGIEDTSQLTPQAAMPWEWAQPTAGPLASILRCDTRPGREPVPGQAHWVVHAQASWSSQHLEQSPEWANAQMQAALADFLGRPINWLHGTVHRWRYAMPQAQPDAASQLHWWDAAQGLGVCGDFLGGPGVDGVEAAWLSARSLSDISSFNHPPPRSST
jgi:renalase